MYQLLDHLF